MKKSEKKNNLNFAFFGTSHIAVYVLRALKDAGLLPALVVTMPDRAQGRGMKLAASPVKTWALENGIEVSEPEKLDSDILKNPRVSGLDVAVLVDYGKIIPKEILEIPRRGFVNVHPSLLPRLRGPSPIRSAILRDEQTGVSIMLMDEELDHGPIIAQKKIEAPEWPPKNSELEKLLLTEGGALLARMLPQWVAGEIDAREQNHDIATYSEKIKKEDGLLDLSADARTNLLKIRALEGWPGTYSFFERGEKSASRRIRVQILDAHIENAKLIIDTVKPEGKKEMQYDEFLRSGARPA